MKNLYEEIKENSNLNHILVCIVGNKNDLYLKESIKKDQVEEYAKSKNAIYRCVSALNSSGINELFEYVGKELIKNLENESQFDESVSNSKITLTKNDKKDIKEQKGCC